MSVRIKPTHSGRWEVDVRVVLPNGLRHRERKRVALSTKTLARRWGEQRERVLISHGVAAKETILRVHLIPLFGETKLDAISTECVQRLKTQLRDRAPKTVNNVLAVLRRLLSVAVEWG